MAAEPRAQLLVAIDAGNTKTDAIALTRDGTVVGWAQSGCGDIYGTDGEAAAVDQVRLAISAVIGGPVENMHLGRIALRLAGLDWPDDTAFWQHVVTGSWRFRGEFSLANDGFASIRLGHLSGIALAITAGTGIALVARNTGGREFGLNMWGPHDMGAKGLGIAGYRAIALSHLGMAPATVLSEYYPRLYGVEDAAELVKFFTSRERRPFKALLAQAAPLVTAAALEGDEVARGIVSEQVELLVSYAAAVAKKVGFTPSEPLPVVLSGRVLRAPGSPVAATLERRLREEFPRSDIRVADLPAVCGAGLDVLAEAGVALSDAIGVRLAATMPREPQVVGVPTAR